MRRTFARIAQIAQGVSIIIGIAVAIANLYASKENTAFALRNMRLSSLQHIANVIKEDGESPEKDVQPIVPLGETTDAVMPLALTGLQLGTPARVRMLLPLGVYRSKVRSCRRPALGK